MTTPTGAATKEGYGFGLGMGSLEGHRAVRHSGGINGFVSLNTYYPDDSLTVVVLTNSSSGEPGLLVDALARATFGLPLPKIARRVTLTAEQRAPYVGSYDVKLPNGAVWRTRVWEGDAGLLLKADVPGQGEIPLIAYGEHTFGAAFDKSLRFTFAVDGGRATRLVVTQRGNVSEGSRVEAPTPVSAPKP